MVDCWSCKNNPENHPWGSNADLEEEEEGMLDHRIFVVDDARELVHSGSKHQSGNRWCHKLKLHKSVFSYLHTTTTGGGGGGGGSREEQRKSAWNFIVESLMQRHPGSQLPERLISTIRLHFESLPLSYAQAGFESEQVFTHIRLIEQARSSGFSVSIQQGSDAFSSSPPGSPDSWEDLEEQSLFIISLASIGEPISKHSIIWAFKRAGIRTRRAQIFERRGLVLGIIWVACERDEALEVDGLVGVLKCAAKKSRPLGRLALGLYGGSSLDGGMKRLTSCRRNSNVECQSENPVSFRAAANRFNVDSSVI